MIRRGKIIATILTVTLCSSLGICSAVSASDGMDYKTALKYSIEFYDANKCGKDVAEDNTFDWRSACHTNDGKEIGHDLTGGYHDAGDHVKFGLPQGYSASVLGWALYEFKDGFTKTNTVNKQLEQLKYFTDYFLKCNYESGKFAYQVGNGDKDHDYWGPPEKQDDTGRDNILIADSSHPASDILGETSAALSIMYLNYKDIDSSYAEKCLNTAKELYQMGKSNPGKGDGQSFYQSSAYNDDLAWAAAWLYDATKNKDYLNDAEQLIVKDSPWLDTTWTMCWNDMKVPTVLKLYQLTGDTKYKNSIEFNMNYWKNGIPTSAGGLKVLNDYGSLRYAAAASMVALVYYKDTKDESLVKLAESQLDYIMGKNPQGMSYLVGYGDKWPQHVHHRAANGYIKNVDDYKNLPNKHVLTGALVGGPDLNDSFKDILDGYTQTEVALDYNAGLVGALAGYVSVCSEGSSEIKLGDVNSDGSVDSSDYMLLKNYIDNGNRGTAINNDSADANKDGKINFLDLIALKNLI